MEEMLELRADEYRKIGKLFGMEKVQQHFSWSKFGLTFFSVGLAFISFPLCQVLDYVRIEADETSSLQVSFASFDYVRIEADETWSLQAQILKRAVRCP